MRNKLFGNGGGLAGRMESFRGLVTKQNLSATRTPRNIRQQKRDDEKSNPFLCQNLQTVRDYEGCVNRHILTLNIR